MSKAVWLLIGIVIGVVIGAAFMYLVHSKPTETPISESVENRTESTEIKVVEVPEVRDEPVEKPEPIAEKPTAQSKLPQSEPTISSDTTPEVQDTIPTVTYDSIDLPVDDIVIKTEKLIQTNQLAIEIIDFETVLADTIGANDSILASLSDIDPNPSAVNLPLTLEYWQSPIGFQGYKMGNRKLVLFGLDPDTGQQVVEFRDTLYLKHFNSFYLLEETFDFKSYQPVIEDELLFLLTEQE